jgi:hypothetical protein
MTETIRQKAWLVLLGAMCGVIPVLSSNWLEQRSENRQRRVDQRLAVLKDYARACNEAAIALQRVVAFNDPATPPAAGALELIERDVAAAALNQATHTHLVRGLFTASAPLSRQLLIEPSAESLEATLKRWNEAATGAVTACEADVKVLVGLLDK